MAQHVNKDLLSEVHLLLRLYLTFPITSSTSERSFSALRRLFTYLRSSMSENRLNQCFLLHFHKELTETLNVEEIAREFIATNDERMRYFGKFEQLASVLDMTVIMCTCMCFIKTIMNIINRHLKLASAAPVCSLVYYKNYRSRSKASTRNNFNFK